MQLLLVAGSSDYRWLESYIKNSYAFSSWIAANRGTKRLTQPPACWLIPGKFRLPCGDSQLQAQTCIRSLFGKFKMKATPTLICGRKARLFFSIRMTQQSVTAKFSLTTK